MDFDKEAIGESTIFINFIPKALEKYLEEWVNQFQHFSISLLYVQPQEGKIEEVVEKDIFKWWWYHI